MKHLTLFLLSALLALASHAATFSVTNTAGGSTLYLAGVGTNDNGMTVQCVVSNAYGSATGAVATLTVTNPASQSYLFKETFDATGYDNAGWTNSADVARANPDYTPALNGAQSLYLNAGVAYSPTISSPQTSMWIHFLLQYHQLDGNDEILRVYAGDTALNFSVRTKDTGALELVTYGTSAIPVATNPIDTPIHVWLHMVSDGTCEIAWSTTTTRPTGGDNYNSCGANVPYTGANRVILKNENFTTRIIDDLVISTSPWQP